MQLQALKKGLPEDLSDVKVLEERSRGREHAGSMVLRTVVRRTGRRWKRRLA
jgi:hypothetical protein